MFAFPSGRSGDVREEEFDSVQPKVTVSWHPNDDWTLYGTYAEGFRSGGFNLSGVSAGVATLVGAGVPGLPQGVQDSFEQEDTEGLRARVQVDAARRAAAFRRALFYTEVDNAFTFVFVAPFTAQTTRNIRAAEISGAETSVSWLATERLELDVGVGLLDSEITASDWIGAGGISIIGKKLPQNPDSTVNVGVGYRAPARRRPRMVCAARLSAARRGVLGAGELHRTRSARSLVDLRVGITSTRGWELVGWIKNATDEDWIAEEANPNGIVYYGKPRQYGVELTYRF